MGNEAKRAPAEKADGGNGAAGDPQPADASAMGNLDQVRDILFGAQIKAYDQRLEQLEQRIMKEIGALRQDTEKSVESLGRSTKKELETLVDRLEGEQSDRLTAIEELAKNVKRMAGHHEAAMVRLDEQLATSTNNLQQHILDQAASLRDDMQQGQAQATDALERETQALRDAKTDRAELGELLMEMAMRLSGESDLPEEG